MYRIMPMWSIIAFSMIRPRGILGGLILGRGGWLACWKGLITDCATMAPSLDI
jgi:hypothetical protein